MKFQNGSPFISVSLKCLGSKKRTGLCQERWVRSIKASLFKHNYYNLQWIMKKLLLSQYHLSISFHFLSQWNSALISEWFQRQKATDSLEGFSTCSLLSKSELVEFTQWASQNKKWSSVSCFTFKNLTIVTIV